MLKNVSKQASFHYQYIQYLHSAKFLQLLKFKKSWLILILKWSLTILLVIFTEVLMTSIKILNVLYFQNVTVIVLFFKFLLSILPPCPHPLVSVLSSKIFWTCANFFHIKITVTGERDFYVDPWILIGGYRCVLGLARDCSFSYFAKIVK